MIFQDGNQTDFLCLLAARARAGGLVRPHQEAGLAVLHCDIVIARKLQSGCADPLRQRRAKYFTGILQTVRQAGRQVSSDLHKHNYVQTSLYIQVCYADGSLTAGCSTADSLQ